TRHDAGFSWRDLDELRGMTKLPLILKGVLRADDAARAVEHGCAALIVSNHGGRQLDGVPATLDALPEVVDAVAGRVEVLVDGGVRWGTDVLKALALGARAVLLGRPILWGLAVDGEAGVRAVLELVRAELSRAMALAGCPNLREIARDLVRPRKSMLR
ncbi:MAG TPA: alpha-hydroxy acid oxidase, partial [Polyangia bacterium]